MAERVRFKFDVQTDATIPKEDMKRRVETALGCSFRDGFIHRSLPAYLTDLLGMRIYLRQTVGIDDSPIFVLHGIIDDSRFFKTPDGERVSCLYQDLSGGIIGILEAFDAGHWHNPSEDEYDATGAAEGAYLDWIAGVPPKDS